MAISITTDLVDVNLSEATTNYAVLGTFATAIAVSPDTYIQSGNTVGGRVSANTAWAHASLAATNLSTGEYHVFQWLKCISVPQLDTKANGGLGITLSSDAAPTLTGVSPSDGPSNSKTWYVAGKTDPLMGWTCYVVNPNSTPDLTLGSPDVTSVQRLGIRAKMLGTVGAGSVKPANVVFDATRYGKGLTYNGDAAGIPGTFSDILVTAMSVGNAWGILTSDSSIYFGAGKFNFGTAAQIAISSFKSVGELFVWRNFPVAATFYAFLIRGAASFATTFQVGNYSAGLTSDGSVIKGSGDPTSATHSVWSLDIGTNTTVNLYGSQFSELYRAILQSATTMRGCTLKNFGNITANGATIDDCTFIELKTMAPIGGTYGIEVATSAPTLTNCLFVDCATAILWNVNADTNGKLNGTTFISGGTGHAIELGANTPTTIELANVTFTSYGANGTIDAAIYNNSGKTITINITNGGNTPTIRNGAGAATTVNNLSTLILTGLVTDTEVRAYVGTNPATATAIVGVESSSTSFTGSHNSSGLEGYIILHALGYVPQTIGLTYAAGTQSIPVQQQADRNYSNP